MINLNVHGRAIYSERSAGRRQDPNDSWQEYELTTPRSLEHEAHLLKLDDDDVLEFVTPEGAVIVLRADEVPYYFDRDPQSRSVTPGVIEVFSELPLDQQEAARSGLRHRLRARLLRILSREIAAAGAVAIATIFEEKAVAYHGLGHGLFRWNGNEGKDGFSVPGEIINAGSPLLVFLHGTASSTTNSHGRCLVSHSNLSPFPKPKHDAYAVTRR